MVFGGLQCLNRFKLGIWGVKGPLILLGNNFCGHHKNYLNSKDDRWMIVIDMP